MTTSSLDSEQGPFLVLVNLQGQHSIWPGWKDAPSGWRIAEGLGPVDRKSALEFVTSEWQDLRPESLRRAMQEEGIGLTAGS